MCTYLTRCLRSGVINFLVGQIWISVSHYGSSWVSSRLLCVSIRVKWRVQGSWGEDIYQATTEVYRLKYLTFKSIQWSYILWSPACSFKKCQKIQKLKDRLEFCPTHQKSGLEKKKVLFEVSLTILVYV